MKKNRLLIFLFLCCLCTSLNTRSSDAEWNLNRFSQKEIQFIIRNPGQKITCIPETIRRAILLTSNIYPANHYCQELNDLYMGIKKGRRLYFCDLVLGAVAHILDTIEQHNIDTHAFIHDAIKKYYDNLHAEQVTIFINQDSENQIQVFNPKKGHSESFNLQEEAFEEKSNAVTEQKEMDTCKHPLHDIICKKTRAVRPDGHPIPIQDPLNIQEICCQCAAPPDNYIFSYATATQQIGVANTYQTIFFQATPEVSGWTTIGSATSFTGFVPSTAGIYEISYNAVSEKTSGAKNQGEIRALLNNVEIPGSLISVDYQANNAVVPMSNTFLKTINPTGVLHFEYAGDSTKDQLNSITIAGATTIPTINVTITKIS